MLVFILPSSLTKSITPRIASLSCIGNLAIISALSNERFRLRLFQKLRRKLQKIITRAWGTCSLCRLMLSALANGVNEVKGPASYSSIIFRCVYIHCVCSIHISVTVTLEVRHRSPLRSRPPFIHTLCFSAHPVTFSLPHVCHGAALSRCCSALMTHHAQLFLFPSQN